MSLPEIGKRKAKVRQAQELARLLTRIEAQGAEHVPKKLVDRALAKAFGFTLKQFSSRNRAIGRENGNVYLFDGDEVLRLPKRLDPLAGALLQTNERVR
jgi:hypothetical protein